MPRPRNSRQRNRVGRNNTQRNQSRRNRQNQKNKNKNNGGGRPSNSYSNNTGQIAGSNPQNLNTGGLKTKSYTAPSGMGMTMINDSPSSVINRLSSINSPEYGVGEVFSFSQNMGDIGSARNSVSGSSYNPFRPYVASAGSGTTAFSVTLSSYYSGMYLTPLYLGGRISAIASTYGLYRFRKIRVTFKSNSASNINQGVCYCISADSFLWPELFTFTTRPNVADVMQVTPATEGNIWISSQTGIEYRGDRCWFVDPSTALAGLEAADIRQAFQYRMGGSLTDLPVDSTTEIVYGRLMIDGVIEFFSPTPGLYAGFTLDYKLSKSAVDHKLQNKKRLELLQKDSEASKRYLEWKYSGGSDNKERDHSEFEEYPRELLQGDAQAHPRESTDKSSETGLTRLHISRQPGVLRRREDF